MSRTFIRLIHYTVKVLFIVSCPMLILLCPLSEAEISEQSDTLETKEQFSDDLASFASKMKNEGFLKEIAIFNKEDFIYLCLNKTPFFTFLHDSQEVVEVKASVDGVALIRYLNKNRQASEEKIALDELFKRNNGVALIEPLVGMQFKKPVYFSPVQPEAKKAIHIFYVYHEGLYFEEIEDNLINIIEESKEHNKAVIYIDEVGLIPPESVKQYMRAYNLNEKDAFEKIKQRLNEEISQFEKGVTLYDSNDFYQKLYNFLASHKIKSYAEDLNYDNWVGIINFDSLNLLDEALSKFFIGACGGATEIITRYLYGFMLFNDINRDINFINQINNIFSIYPEATIITVRGAGHYGFESGFGNDIDVNIYIMGKRGERLEDIIPYKNLWMVIKQCGVNISPEAESLLGLKSLLEFIMLEYCMTELNMSHPQATLYLRSFLSPLTLEDIYTVCNRLTMRAFLSKEDDRDAQQFLYDWLIEYNKTESSAVETSLPAPD